ncbi:MAG: hypothetical protein M5U12_35135 [Verrucomicrobia bacterium]|nr:hypothetical protein [Verrucomicrobiota bacterium]
MFPQLWKSRWPLLAVALSFQMLENLLFAPSMGVIGGVMVGRPVVDSTALVEFLLSPRGFAVFFLAATVSLTIRLTEHAGLSAMVLGALEGKRPRATATFRWLVAELPRLAAIGARVVGWGVLLVTPPLAVAGVLVPRLLKQHDINYYLASRPPEFINTAAAIAAVAAATLSVGVCLLVRWRLVVQVCIFDRRNGKAAFQEAAVLSRGVWGKLAGRCFAVMGLLLVLLVAAAGSEQIGVWLVLGLADSGELSLSVSFGLILLLRTLIGASVTALGAGVDAALFTAFYRQRRRQLGGAPPSLVVEQESTSRQSLPTWAKGFAGSLVLGLLAAAGMSVVLAADALRHEGRLPSRPIEGITDAPPRTLPPRSARPSPWGPITRRLMSRSQRTASWW